MASLAEALAHCLDTIGKGERDIEGCLAMYPQWEQELRSLLVLALAVRSLSEEAEPSPGYVEQTKAHILSTIQQEGEKSG